MSKSIDAFIGWLYTSPDPKVLRRSHTQGDDHRQIEEHKDLAEIIHNLLEISLAPGVPASLETCF
ncbi:hypothetical protein B0H13DRAFT_2335430 [Mycena leptocephala]|nr:hypothetical protein B0H13DRAFT_2335430 [Mycena leptocephala]